MFMKRNKHSIKTLLALIALCPLFTSCASIVHGTTQKVPVSTSPEGATIFDGKNTYISPATIELKRKDDHIITISKPGYETETVKISPVISGAVAGNILAGGFIGWGVDAISGAQWRLVPETLAVNLRPAQKYNPELNENHISQGQACTPLEKKLMELQTLLQKNMITADEYKTMRELAIRSSSEQK